MDPIPKLARRLWHAWDIRILIVVSLTIQMILCFIGKRRNYKAAVWIRILVWLAYMGADGVATLTLGKLSDTDFYSSNMTSSHGTVLSMWAPLLLLHLGGPDTITAYALEDNQLWLRHLLGLVFQLLVSIYVVLMSWRVSWFSLLSVLLLVAGTIKYSERVFVLNSARGEQSHKDIPIRIKRTGQSDERERNAQSKDNGLEDGAQEKEYSVPLIRAHSFCQFYKPHIANYILRSKEGVPKTDLMKDKHQLSHWAAMQVEMGLMYDLLYTKAPIIYTKRGIFLRFISFSCIGCSLFGFFMIIVFNNHKLYKEKNDVIFTCVLLVGAFLLEIYAAVRLLFSDWARVWLHYHRGDACKMTSCLLSAYKNRGWFSSMGQLNLLDASHEKISPLCRKLLNWFGLEETFDNYKNKTSEAINDDLKKGVIKYLFVDDKPITADGSGALQSNGKHDLAWTTRLDFDDRIIIWHIATEICYHESDKEGDRSKIESCKLLSHYMMYLLLMWPNMLPDVIPHVMCRYTKKALKKTNSKGSADNSGNGDKAAYWSPAELAQLSSHTDTGDTSTLETLNSVARKAVFICSSLKLQGGDNKWEVISSVWMEMLCYAAKKCQQKDHAQQLRRGGELLTIVWLLITQSTLSENVRKGMVLRDHK